MVQDGAELLEFGCGNEIGFVDKNHIRELDLIHKEVRDRAFVLFAKSEVFFLQGITRLVVLEKIRGVHNRDHGVEARDVLKSGPALVGKGEGLRHRERLGNPGGLDQEVVEAPFLREAAHLF